MRPERFGGVLRTTGDETAAATQEWAQVAAVPLNDGCEGDHDHKGRSQRAYKGRHTSGSPRRRNAAEAAPRSFQRNQESCIARLTGGTTGDDDDIPPAQAGLPMTETLARQPFQAVSVDRAADLAARKREPEPRPSQPVAERQHPYLLIRAADRRSENRPEIRFCPEPTGACKSGARLVASTPQKLKRLRPLARLALKTLCPPLVAMRARKPHRRLRLILLG